MTLFYDGNSTSEDAHSRQVMDITLGLSFIVMFAVSIVMNPLSFLYHSRKGTLLCALYTYLAICDFVVNLWHPITVARHLLATTTEPDHIATMNERCAFFIYFTFSSFSGLLINIILIAGAAQIARPTTTRSLGAIPNGPVLRLVSALLGLYSLLQFLVAFAPDNIGPPIWASWSMAIHYQNSLEVVVWVTYIIFFIPGPFALFAAINHLSKEPSTAEDCFELSRFECIKILLLCVPNFAYPIFLTIDFFTWHRQAGQYQGATSEASLVDANVMTFFGKTFFPVFSSAWNPVFICLFTKDMKRMIRDLMENGNSRQTLEEHNIL